MKHLIFIGGWTRSRETYRKLQQSTPANWQVHIIPHSELIDESENKLLQILKDNDLKQVHLAGHSLGGEICMRFASRYPEKVEKLFLIDSCGVKGDNATYRMLQHIYSNQLYFGRQKLGEDYRSFIEFLKRPTFYTKYMRHFFQLDLKKQAHEIISPTIIFAGTKDYLVTLKQMQTLNHWIKNSELAIMEGLGHDWIIHEPELFWRYVI